jgi:hypothetical protein
MTVLIEVPLDEGGTLLVEADRADIPGVTLAAPDPGKAVAIASRSLASSLDQIEPVVRALRSKLENAAPDNLAVEFGIKLGGETGVILAKGTAEVNLKITMSWNRGR